MRGKGCFAFPHYCRGRQGTDPPAPAGSNSLAFPGSRVGLPGYEIPPGQNCERVKGARLPAQPPGVARELIPLPLRGAVPWQSQEVGWGMPEYEIPPGLSCERVKGDRLPAQMLWAPHFREGAFVGEP